MVSRWKQPSQDPTRTSAQPWTQQYTILLPDFKSSSRRPLSQPAPGPRRSVLAPLPTNSPSHHHPLVPKGQPIPTWGNAHSPKPRHHPPVPKGQPIPAWGTARTSQFPQALPNAPTGPKCDSLGHRPRSTPTNHPASCRDATYRHPPNPPRDRDAPYSHLSQQPPLSTTPAIHPPHPSRNQHKTPPNRPTLPPPKPTA